MYFIIFDEYCNNSYVILLLILPIAFGNTRRLEPIQFNLLDSSSVKEIIYRDKRVLNLNEIRIKYIRTP